jgi:hypothetical protein
MVWRNRAAPGPLYFLHIEKTGGTSLTTALVRQYVEEDVFIRDDGYISVQFLNSIEPSLQRNVFIAGHAHAGVVEHLWDRARIITVVRDPAHQAASYYLHARRHEGHFHHACAKSLSFRDYLTKHPQYLVFQTSSIVRAAASGVADFVRYSVEHTDDVITLMRRFDVVGITERLSEMAPIVSKLTPGDRGVRVPRLNAAISHGSDHVVVDELVWEYRTLDADERLAPYIAAERRLYEASCGRMDEILSQFAPEALRQIPARLPANQFHCVGGKLCDEVYEIPLQGVNGCVIYGPYESLEPGEYEIEFNLSATDMAPLSRGSLFAEVVDCTGRRLAGEVIRSGLGRQRAAFCFTNTDRRDVLEYRLFSRRHPRGLLRFGGVTIRPAGSPP